MLVATPAPEPSRAGRCVRHWIPSKGRRRCSTSYLLRNHALLNGTLRILETSFVSRGRTILNSGPRVSLKQRQCEIWEGIGGGNLSPSDIGFSWQALIAHRLLTYLPASDRFMLYHFSYSRSKQTRGYHGLYCCRKPWNRNRSAAGLGRHCTRTRRRRVNRDKLPQI